MMCRRAIRASASGRSRRRLRPSRSSATSRAARPQLGNRTPERAFPARAPADRPAALDRGRAEPVRARCPQPGGGRRPAHPQLSNRPASARRSGAAGRPGKPQRRRAGAAAVLGLSTVRPAPHRQPERRRCLPADVRRDLLPRVVEAREIEPAVRERALVDRHDRGVVRGRGDREPSRVRVEGVQRRRPLRRAPAGEPAALASRWRRSARRQVGRAAALGEDVDAEGERCGIRPSRSTSAA